MPILACVVEGEGDERSLPLLIRRIARDWDPLVHIHVFISKRVGREKLVNQGGIENAVEQAARDGGPDAAILVLLDADDDCPATLGPTLLDRARKTRPDRQVSVVLAKREYEAWFLAAAISLRGQRGLPEDLDPPYGPEGIRDAKGWLGEKCLVAANIAKRRISRHSPRYLTLPRPGKRIPSTSAIVRSTN